MKNKRTELSDELTNPLFIANNFSFPINSGKVEVWQRIHFGLYLVSKEKYAIKDSVKWIGEWILELGQLAKLINSPESMGVKQSLSFIKIHQETEYQVGRFNITLSIDNDYSKKPGLENSYFNGGISDPIEASSMVHHMPLEEPKYLWRLRIDLRWWIDAPMNTVTATKLPSWYAEFGWSSHSQMTPEPQNRLLSLLIPQERHPHWNQQLLYHSPQEWTERDGFFWISLYDKEANSNSFEYFYIPMSFFEQFKPVHLQILWEQSDFASQPSLFISLTLEEEIESFVDTPWTVAIRWVDFDPLPLKTRNFMIIMTTDDSAPENDPFIKVDLREEQAIARAFKYTNDFSNMIFISPWFRMPPDPIKNKYNSLFYFTVPKSYLDKKVRFFAVVKDDNKVSTHGMPNLVVGATEIADQELRRSLYSVDHDPYTFPVEYFPDLTIVKHLVMSKWRIEITCHPIEVIDKLVMQTRGKSRAQSRARRGDHFNIFDEKDRWQLLSKDLAQKQELIHRVMKDNTDRSNKLKETGKEVLELRKVMKLLKMENYNLAKKIEVLKDIDSKSMMTPDIKDMHYADVK